MAWKKLYEFLNSEGKKYFTSVKRTNHFVVLNTGGSLSEEAIEKLKKVDQVIFIRIDGYKIWLRIKGSLNKLLNNLDGSIRIEEYDRFDKDLWLWYIENETPFRYRWTYLLFRWFLWW